MLFMRLLRDRRVSSGCVSEAGFECYANSMNGLGARARCTGSVYGLSVRARCTGSVHGLGARAQCTGSVHRVGELKFNLENICKSQFTNWVQGDLSVEIFYKTDLLSGCTVSVHGLGSPMSDFEMSVY